MPIIFLGSLASLTVTFLIASLIQGASSHTAVVIRAGERVRTFGDAVAGARLDHAGGWTRVLRAWRSSSELCFGLGACRPDAHDFEHRCGGCARGDARRLP